MKKDLLFVDGYNMIGAWPHLVKLQRRNELSRARDLLLNDLSEYAKYENIEVRVIFDAMFVPGIEKKYHYDGLMTFSSIFLCLRRQNFLLKMESTTV